MDGTKIGRAGPWLLERVCSQAIHLQNMVASFDIDKPCHSPIRLVLFLSEVSALRRPRLQCSTVSRHSSRWREACGLPPGSLSKAEVATSAQCVDAECIAETFFSRSRFPEP